MGMMNEKSYEQQVKDLDAKELAKHARVSSYHRCGCGTCFCCLCLAEQQRRLAAHQANERKLGVFINFDGNN
jgi:hypothetical protein